MTLFASILVLASIAKSTSAFAGVIWDRPYSLPSLFVAHKTAYPEAPDITRARDCAENFGICSLDEIEEIKKGIKCAISTRFLLSLGVSSY
jgi:hypothetical protein